MVHRIPRNLAPRTARRTHQIVPCTRRTYWCGRLVPSRERFVVAAVVAASRHRSLWERSEPPRHRHRHRLDRREKLNKNNGESSSCQEVIEFANNMWDQILDSQSVFLCHVRCCCHCRWCVWQCHRTTKETRQAMYLIQYVQPVPESKRRFRCYVSQESQFDVPSVPPRLWDITDACAFVCQKNAIFQEVREITNVFQFVSRITKAQFAVAYPKTVTSCNE